MPNPFSGDVRSVRRPTRPTDQKWPFIPGYTVTPGKTHQVMILSPRVEWYYIHVNMGRTYPCTGHGEDCEYSHAEFATIVEGRVWVTPFHRNTLHHLTLTGYVHRSLPLLSDDSVNLVGRKLALKRRDHRPWSAMIAEFCDLECCVAKPFPVPSMIEFLGKLWAAPPRPVPRMSEAKMLSLIRQVAGESKGGAA